MISKLVICEFEIRGSVTKYLLISYIIPYCHYGQYIIIFMDYEDYIKCVNFYCNIDFIIISQLLNETKYFWNCLNQRKVIKKSLSPIKIIKANKIIIIFPIPSSSKLLLFNRRAKSYQPTNTAKIYPSIYPSW